MKSRTLPFAISLTLSLSALSAVYAGSATWNINPPTSDWNTARNWTPATVPNGNSAKNANFTINGGAPGSGFGGDLVFNQESDVGNAICVINGGTDGGPGGYLELSQSCTGGAARIELFGNGTLDMTSHDRPGITIGSLEGDGIVLLGDNNLTVGSNSLTADFSGKIQNTGSLTKIGAGKLRLSGGNTYTRGTTVEAGTLVIANQSGSGTGRGSVSVTAGTLGGSGIIAGATTIGTGSGTGAFLAPAAGTLVQATLTIQNALTFHADATYTCTFRAKQNRARTDQVIASGVTIRSGTNLTLSGQSKGALDPGNVADLDQ